MNFDILKQNKANTNDSTVPELCQATCIVL